MNSSVFSDSDTAFRDAVDIDLALLEQRFAPTVIWKISVLAVYAVIITSPAMAAGMTTGPLAAVIGLMIGWLVSMLCLRGSAPFWGTRVTVVVVRGKVARVNRYPICDEEDVADACVVVFTPGFFAKPWIGFVSRMTDFSFPDAVDEPTNIQTVIKKVCATTRCSGRSRV